MEGWLIGTLVIIIILFLLVFGAFIFFMVKDWNREKHNVIKNNPEESTQS